MQKIWLWVIAGLWLCAGAVPTDVQAASFGRAQQVGQAHLPNCGEGGFPDLIGQCWRCPNGFAHDNVLLTPNDPHVCRALPHFSAGIRHAKAGIGCPAGQWPSLHNGRCYTCPEGYGHDLLRNGDDPRVCFKRQPEQVDFARGLRYGRTVLGLGCPAGQWPSLHNGHCYACPAGFGHDVARNGDDPRVCFRRRAGSTQFAAGQVRGQSNVGLCPAGQWLSTHDGACYTCPAGFGHDVARFGNDPQVCFQRQDRYSAASANGSLLCNSGFYDPIRGGSCWACPAPHRLRTVAPVDGDRACTDQVAGIVAIDVCTPLLGAIREGQKGLDTVNRLLQPVLGPILEPVNQGLQQVMGKIRSPAALDQLLAQFGRGLDPLSPYLDEMSRLNAQLPHAGEGLRNLLLDPQVVCKGDVRDIDRRLSALDLRPSFVVRKTSWLDRLPLPSAHAAGSTAFVLAAVNVDVPVKPPQLAISVTVSVVTNFQGEGGAFLSLGGSFAPTTGVPQKEPLASAAVHLMAFPSATLDSFSEIQDLGVELALDTQAVAKVFPRARAGGGTTQAATPAGTVTVPVPPAGSLDRPAAPPGAAGMMPGAGKPPLPDALVVSFDPTDPLSAGLGVSYELGSRGPQPKRDEGAFSGSVDFTFPLWILRR